MVVQKHIDRNGRRTSQIAETLSESRLKRAHLQSREQMLNEILFLAV